LKGKQVLIRPLDPDCLEEVEWVAQGMRQTLLEVVGEELYPVDWLRQRVLSHLDPRQIEGAVFLALSVPSQEILGHTIVRLEQGWGLFSTTYVDPRQRCRGVARRLLARGENWMRLAGAERARTFTAADNQKLQKLFQSAGYQLTHAESGFVCLSRGLRVEHGGVVQNDTAQGDQIS